MGASKRIRLKAFIANITDRRNAGRGKIARMIFVLEGIVAWVI